MKCELCKKTIEQTFLGKILGTYVKNSKGKQHVICFECQKKFRKKEEILAQLK
ncbi:MAG: hypothetical protein QXR48_01460 [Candidatus Woesearchaeota archaeon]